MKRTGRMVQLLLALLLLLYAVDWGLLRIRTARGSAYETLEINEYLATPLKGNKAEYDYMGTRAETCARSMFPQTGDLPCWWLEKHTTHWQH